MFTTTFARWKFEIKDLSFLQDSHDKRSQTSYDALFAALGTRTSTRFGCPFLAKVLRKFITRTIKLRLLFVSSIGCSVILIACN